MVILLVSGCAGKTSSEGTEAPDSATETADDAPTSRTLEATTGGASTGSGIASYDASSGKFNVTLPSGALELDRFALADHGQMLAFRDVAGVHNAYFGDGNGAQVVVYSGGLAGNVLNYATFARVGATEMPLSGTAQFNGQYAGFTTTRRVNGTAQLNVNFATNTISGEISNRSFRQRPDNVPDVVNPLSTVVLEPTGITTQGGFAGTASGGQIVNGQMLWNPSSGSYAGLIGGANAGTTVGTLNLNHRAPSGVTFEEVGGFLATR